ncbi:MAG TPA: alpha-amylase family glycosyl hydrolase, partial [Bacteroidales bacterium]|nr:alpha-amylase family glycosyl hydrolase [Bacteroidales bacterium]
MERKRLFTLVFAFAAVWLLFSCRQQPAPDPGVITLHQPVWLGYDTTRIWYSDFMPPDTDPDSIVILDQRVPVQNGEKSFLFKADTTVPPMFAMHLWYKGKSTDVLLKRSPVVKISYRFDPGTKVYRSVSLKGEFNGWTPSRTPLQLKDGVWQTDLLVSAGRYQYLLVADGAEMTDPGCSLKESNQMGGFNSVLVAGNDGGGYAPLLIPERSSRRKIWIRLKHQPEHFIVLCNNRIIDESRYRVNAGELQIQIPRDAYRNQRSWIRVYAWNNEGAGNDVLIPLAKGRVIMDPSQLSRNDLHTAIMYNVFVDRFFNGNPGNDKHLPDSIVLPRANYFGGDLAGVLQKVEEGYFKDLGVNTLWLSPVVKNADGPYGQWNDPPTKFSSYHGYWPVSFTETDSHFGTADELKALSESLHKAGMNILLDFVAHHVHQDHPYYKANPDIATNLYLPDGTLNTEKWDVHRLTTW